LARSVGVSSALSPMIQWRARCRPRRPVARELEECEHGDECEAFVAVEECLAFRDAVGEHGRLQREVGVLVVGVAGGSCEGAFESGSRAENRDRLFR
jgi:hypothetical protein